MCKYETWRKPGDNSNIAYRSYWTLDYKTFGLKQQNKKNMLLWKQFQHTDCIMGHGGKRLLKATDSA